ncbi:MAG: gentisate 1,2-dioxygenase [SAR324 cluster bacterium]|nr:gentisate 1,2-dioxygenase [SAR324 cluster bacterium]
MAGKRSAAERKAFYGRIDPLHMAPLWETFHELVTPEPVTPCVPSHWAYERVRPHLMEAGRLISAKEAERRVLILENPALRGQASITLSLYAGLQLVLPGETAPCHRHSQSALRLIIEGSGAYTSVNGEPAYMEKGDFIITGAWSWHDHGNDTSEPVVWLDGLDVPLVRFFDASFFERFPEESHPRQRPAGDNAARYGANMMPVGERPHGGHSPVFRYPYARSREALEQMRRLEEWDTHHALKMEFINPADGGPVMPTISAFLQLLPQGFTTAPYRSTDGTVYTVIEGRGESTIGDTTFAWRPGDVFVVPSWYSAWHRGLEESVLFSFSDRGVQEKLGLWKERKE